MKKPLKLLLIFVVLVIAALVALPFLIPAETYKKEVLARIEAATGREVTLAGAVQASFWPNIGVKLTQVSIANPEGFEDKQMADIGALTAEVAVLPLLSGDVQIKRFILDKPVIRLGVNKAGKNNWQFAPGEAPPQASSGFISSAHAEGLEALKKVTLGEVKVNDGTLLYRDARSRAAYSAEALNLALSLPHIDAPLSLKGNAVWNKEKVNFALDALKARALAEGGETPLKLSVQSGSLVQVLFSGKASVKGAAGALEFGTTSLPKLAAWAGTPMDWKQTALTFGAKGQLACTQTQCALSNADIVADAIQLHGDVKAKFGGAVPAIEAKLATETLDVNPYLPPEKRAAVISFISEAQAAAWSTERIDLSGLKAANANVNLNIGTLIYKAVKISKVAASVQLSGGALKLSIPQAGLYGGTARINLSADAGGAVGAEIRGSGIQAEPLLKDFAQFDRLSGTAEIALNVNGRGASQAQIIQSLGGNGSVRLTDGAIKGINIAQMVRNIQSAFLGAATSEKTDFAELGGTFSIAQGIFSNNDLAMKAPLVRLKGAGTVDLPRQYVRYRLTPELVGTIKGQGGKDKEGLEVPVIVEGTFDRLTFRPDMEGAIKDVLNDPEKAREQLKNIKEQFKDSKGGVKEQLKEIQKDPAQLQNLLKGFGR